MSDEIKLFCWVQGDKLNDVFVVRIKLSDIIADLKKAIRAEKLSFQQVDIRGLRLWKLQLSLEVINDNDTNDIVLKEDETLSPWRMVSDCWEKEPANGILSVAILHTATTITPSSSNSSNLSEGHTPHPVQNNTSMPPSWLVEIHSKLWRRRDLFDQLFRTANLTEADFTELQAQLQSLNHSRQSEDYVPPDVLATKLNLLHSRSFVEIATAAHFAKCNPGSYGNLVPELFIDKSEDLTPLIADAMDAHAVDTDAFDVGAVGTDAMNEAMDIDVDEVTYPLEGSPAIFPCTIRYMDLTFLDLKDLKRVPHLMLIRDEWRTVVRIFNERKKGVEGGAAFTGQPGIGKTCLLYYVLILCLILGQPIIYQDIGGTVFIVDNEIKRNRGKLVVPGDDVLALVDADGEFCKPDSHLLDAVNLRVLLVSPPRRRKDRKWLTQSVGDPEALYVMEPWSREEFLVTSLFLAPIDITFSRFQDVTRICGCSPRQCLKAAASPTHLLLATKKIRHSISDTKNLSDAITKVHTGQAIHRAFEIYPSPQEGRHWESCCIRPVSEWAFSAMLAELDRQSIDAAFNFYRIIQGSHDSSSLVGKMFEAKTHIFFRSITEPRIFTIRSLDHPSTSFDITYASGTTYHTFGSNQQFSGHVVSSVQSVKSCYLRPLSPIFATFDSFFYQPKTNFPPNCQPLVGFQITIAHSHPISVKGLAAIQTALKHSIPELKGLRPSTKNKLIILFVVPDDIEPSFVKQHIKDAPHWGNKTAQYVLGLSEREVMRSC